MAFSLSSVQACSQVSNAQRQRPSLAFGSILARPTGPVVLRQQQVAARVFGSDDEGATTPHSRLLGSPAWSHGIHATCITSSMAHTDLQLHLNTGIRSPRAHRLSWQTFQLVDRADDDMMRCALVHAWWCGQETGQLCMLETRHALLLWSTPTVARSHCTNAGKQDPRTRSSFLGMRSLKSECLPGVMSELCDVRANTSQRVACSACSTPAGTAHIWQFRQRSNTWTRGKQLRADMVAT